MGGTMAGNVYIDALAGTSSFLKAGRDREITYFFDNDGSRAWTANEKAGMRKALQSWADVANLTFKEVASRDQADISEKLYARDLMAILVAPGVTALHAMPDAFNEIFEGIYSITGTPDDLQFNLERYAITSGSRNLQIFIHEIGHALGLDHPHDVDVGTGVIPGVTGPKDLGTYGLNQNIYTVMSYNDYGKPSAVSGHVAGPMAFDIAAIQKLYGANMKYKAGDTGYALSSSKSSSFWQCLWDAGGVDHIGYDGAGDAVIDLRAATLAPGPNAGGYLSQVNGTNGGFTIAKGVVIENATGGSGDDTLNGNGSRNALKGRDGDDKISGLNGSDRLYGGIGRDTLSGGKGDDVLKGGADADKMSGGLGRDTFDFDWVSHSKAVPGRFDTITDFLPVDDTIDLSTIDANATIKGDQAFVVIEGPFFTGKAGELLIIGCDKGVLIAADTDGDRGADFGLLLAGASRVNETDFVL
jgi:serralysin